MYNLFIQYYIILKKATKQFFLHKMILLNKNKYNLNKVLNFLRIPFSKILYKKKYKNIFCKKLLFKEQIILSIIQLNKIFLINIIIANK